MPRGKIADTYEDVEMKPTAVLVLSRDENSYVLESVFSIGLAPVVRDDMHEALDKIRHDRFAMIVVDRNRADVDVLEFILNVRDIDVELPVVVIGQEGYKADTEILKDQPKTFLVEEFDTADEVARELERVLDTC